MSYNLKFGEMFSVSCHESHFSDFKDQQEQHQSFLNQSTKNTLHQHGQAASCLDLANHLLTFIPQEVFDFTKLQQLYLENNKISELPMDFFHRLPSLVWLDLRRNQLRNLPVTVGDHKCLKQLLLEGNCITHLPVELGNVETLTGLSLHGNPIEFPPQHVVAYGIKSVKLFLKDEWTKIKVAEGVIVETKAEANKEFVNKSDGLLSSVKSRYQTRRNCYTTVPSEKQMMTFMTPITVNQAKLKKRTHETPEQLIELYKKRQEIIMKEKKLIEQRKKREAERRAREIAGLSTTHTNKVISNYADGIVSDASIMMDTTNDEVDGLHSHLHQLDDLERNTLDQSGHIRQEFATPPLKTRASTTEDDIRRRMRLHSRNMSRQRAREQQVVVDDNNTEPINPQSSDDAEYRFRAFTPSLISRGPTRAGGLSLARRKAQDDGGGGRHPSLPALQL